MSERSPISDASLLGRGKGKFSIQYFFKRRRLFVVMDFFNMGFSAAWMLTIEIFQINGLSRKKPGSIAINERQYSGCGFRISGSCGRATSQMLDRRAMKIQIVELYRVKKDIKALKGFFGVNSG